MHPSILQRHLPSGLTPDLHNGKAFVSIVVSDLENMRPSFFPKIFGFDYTQIVYRAIVRAPNGERGVYFIRSDANSVLMSLSGTLFSNFHFNLADVLWQGARQHLPLVGVRGSLDSVDTLTEDSDDQQTWSGSDGHKTVHFALEPWNCVEGGEEASIRASYDMNSASLMMPAHSSFNGETVRDAQKYFVELYTAFASWPAQDMWTAVRIDRTQWNLVAVNHQAEVEPVYSFMQSSRSFPAGTCKLDSVFYVHDLNYYWRPAERHARTVEDRALLTEALVTSPFNSCTSPGYPANDALVPPVRPTMYFDGLCPLCSKEVAHYSRLSDKVERSTGTRPVDFVDVSTEDPSVELLFSAFGVTSADALLRLHVIDKDGTLRTGIRGFGVVWSALPYWKLLGFLVKNVPWFPDALELLYAGFLKWRNSWRGLTTPGTTANTIPADDATGTGEQCGGGTSAEALVASGVAGVGASCRIKR